MSAAAAACLGGSGTGGGGGGALTATISAGETVSGATNNYTFPANTCVPAGGSGTYTYLWAWSNPSGIGSWPTGQTTATVTETVSAVFQGGNTSFAYAVCTVTDTVTGLKATSNQAVYQYTNIRGGHQ